MEKKGNKQETAGNRNQSGSHLIDKFAKSESSAEIKNIADRIIEADPDIDREKLDEKAAQFHKEKRKDAQKQAENDAGFEQPEGDDL